MLSSTQKITLYIVIFIGGITFFIAGIALVFMAEEPPVKGSDDWCEQMLLTAHDQWQEQDFSLFAKECLDPEPIFY